MDLSVSEAWFTGYVRVFFCATLLFSGQLSCIFRIHIWIRLLQTISPLSSATFPLCMRDSDAIK